MEGGLREGVYLRSLETTFLVISSGTICLVTDRKTRLCVLLAGQYLQKVKNNFLLVSLWSESLKIIVLLMIF